MASKGGLGVVSGKTAKDIRVGEFREILIWPFRLDGYEKDPAKLRDEARSALAKYGWREEKTLHHLLEKGQQPGKYEYQEYVYFYPFVRDFLYGGEGEAKEIILMRRPDLTGLRASFAPYGAPEFTVEFAVPRLNFYLFDAGIVVLALELANSGDICCEGRREDMSLFHAQVIQERLRRAYPPYWDDTTGVAGYFPQTMEWLPRTGYRSIGRHQPPMQADMVELTLKGKEPPPASHWRELLAPLLPTDKAAVHLRQVVDERIPLMLYLSVDDPRTISRGDWVRLAMCDESGSGELPYGRGFLGDFEKQHCYDRHWITDENGVADPTAASRYLFSGYGFVAVGGNENGFFTNPLKEHFRRHYFQLGLLAHFEYAALLAESKLLANATGKGVEEALKRVLEFTQKYWFVDVSNQVQAREMFALWRKHLNTEALYKQVLEEARAVADFQEAQGARRSADATTRLTVAALLIAVPTLATGFLGMNVLVDENSALGPLKEWDNGGWATVGWAIALSAIVIAILSGLAWLLTGRRVASMMNLAGFFIMAALVAGFVAFTALPLPPKDKKPEEYECRITSPSSSVDAILKCGKSPG